MLPGTTDVLVTGAGPAGLTAAVSLAAGGRGVIVADSQAEGQNTSRSPRPGLRGAGLPLTSRRSQDGSGSRSRVPG